MEDRYPADQDICHRNNNNNNIDYSTSCSSEAAKATVSEDSACGADESGSSEPACSSSNRRGPEGKMGDMFSTAKELLLQSGNISSSQSSNTTNDSVEVARRRIHLGPVQCQALADSDHGSRALTQPHTIKTSSRDPSLGLYPRNKCNRPQLPQRDQSLSGSFVKASSMIAVSSPANRADLHPETSRCDERAPNYLDPSHSSESSAGTSKKRQRKGFPEQKNKLDSYFKPAQKPNVSQCKTKTEAVDNSASPGKRKIYGSPLKKVAGSESFYTLDSSQASGSCEQQPTQSTSSIKDITKDLFEAQKKLSGKPPVKKRKKNEPTFNRDNKFLYGDSESQSGQHSVSSQTADKVYGLLGSTDAELINLLDDDDDDFTPRDYTSDLPDEILENILCQLPLSDLCLHVNRVCHRWHSIISHPKFVPWKKKYAMLVRDDEEEREELLLTLSKHGMSSEENYQQALFSFIQGYKPVTARNMTACLKQHPLYEAAKLLIEERHLAEQHDRENPWLCITVLIFLASSVQDITKILRCLLCKTSQCRTYEVLECFYCIASVLWLYKDIKYKNIWTGMHYKVYYALYLFENESVSTCGQLQGAFNHNRGQQSIDRYAASDTSVRLTHEQLRVCNYDVQRRDIVKIVAFAGTGKTTTLVRYTQLRPGLKFLMVVYNKSVADHAKQRFPHNVKCRTGHSLAFQIIGRRYAAVGKLRTLRVGDVADFIPKRKGISLYVQAKFVIDTLTAYMASDHANITTAHVPDSQVTDDGTKKVIDHETKMNLANDAEKIWEKMVDVKHTRLPLTHDGYLKLYQLRKPQISTKEYDVILIDEAQDLTPAIADILLHQQQAKILVGDPHQQIYLFRGAVNAMDQVQASKIFYLTQSFRFGPEIAFTAATCLEFLKGEKQKMIVGNGIQGGVSGDTVGQVAVICRSNFTVFCEAVKKCCFNDDNIKVAFAGGLEAFGIEMIEDIYLLSQGEFDSIRNPLVKRFAQQGYIALKKYAKQTSEAELLGKINIVETFNNALPGYINKIRRKCIRDIDMADFVFSTAHKAKGLEFSTVKVTDDFNVVPTAAIGNVFLEQVNQSNDENNLLYVAVTRAKKRLILSKTLVGLMSSAGEKFHVREMSSRMLEKNCEMKCVETDQPFKPTAITLAKRSYVRSDGIKSSSGLFSPQWVTETMPSLKNLMGTLPTKKSS